MRNKILALMVGATALAGITAWAQPGDYPSFPGDRPFEREGMHARKLERVAEYLDLSEAQASEWQQLMDDHLGRARERRGRIDELRSEFRGLASEPSPDLAQLGGVALNIHRALEAGRSEREQLVADLGALLTPEQMERFEALQVARDIARPRFGPHSRHRARRGPERP